MRILAVRPLADSAVTLELAQAPGAGAAALVAAAVAALERAMEAGELPGLEDVAGAFVSVTLHYDSLAIAQHDLMARVARILDPVHAAAGGSGRTWHLPCCYDAACGIDLPELSRSLGLPEAEIVARHAAVTFRVLALGFLPGLPFLGELPADLSLPRRSEPRTRVPAGSVAIANRMCVIYPWESPGGWHIVGCCPVPLFDIARPVPALLAVGDSLRFVPVARAEFDRIRRDAGAGRLDHAGLLTGG
jgi:KipI family sensor histidine kinase inhibitor